ASRVAARSSSVALSGTGGLAAARSAARRDVDALLAGDLRSARTVKVAADGAVTLRSRVPLVGPFRALGSRRGPTITARSRFDR
ncbi:MAG: hypothetical protein WAP35_07050, partial [Solirubrobacterales bacterium]